MSTAKNKLLITLAVTCMTAQSHAGLSLVMDYTNFISNAPGSVNTILNGQSVNDAIAVMDHAAAIWEKAFENSSSGLSWSVGGNLTQTIDVDWAAKGGSTLATGGTSWYGGTYEWAGGSLDWDNDGSSNFFVDTTPYDSAEWQQSSLRWTMLGGVNINVENVRYDAFAGTARSYSDMLSVALHEIGHTLGFLSGYPLYTAADIGSDSDIDITSGTYNGADIPITGGHADVTLDSPGNDALGSGKSDFPYDPGGGSYFPNSTYDPMAMSASSVTGVRYGLTAADIAIVAQFLDFDMSTVDFNPVVVPEPSSWLLISAGGLLLLIRRRR